MISASPDNVWAARSWVESANDSTLGFPLQSLPYCSFVRNGSSAADAHLGVGIGYFILDLCQLAQTGLLATLDAPTRAACTAAQLNALLHCGPTAWSGLRQRLTDLLRDDAPANLRPALAAALIPQTEARFLKPVAVTNYTDFYASIHHATNVGKLFRPDQPLLPNYSWIPIGYHGRASSIVVSGTAIRRPSGQCKLPAEATPTFRPSTHLDYELEVAATIGTGNPLGTPIPIAVAERHLFGISLLNDWSARDIQSWEAQPLGPFLGKSFATTVSPWVVPLEALQPFRSPLTPRPIGQPQPLPYLAEDSLGIDLTLEVFLSTARMREASLAPARLSTANLLDLHWTFAQLIAHHTSNGCNLLAGDLLATGTVSGPQPNAQGCLLEMTQRGTHPITLPNGETRAFLEDGDEVILRGFCQREDYPRISLGDCHGTILPAS
jgi:fumarylacetoacetase